MTLNQQSKKVSERDNMKTTTPIFVICIAMFVVMASFGVMAAGPMNATVPTAITNPSLMASTPPVDLGSVGNYTIFANTGIADTPTSNITGDIGVGPGYTSTAITGFTPALSWIPGDAYSTCPEVTGKVYAKDYADPARFNVENASLNMSAAYDDAFNRAAGTGPFLNVGAGTVTDQTLAPGVYTWTSFITIPTDLTLNGTPTDVWIFQVAGYLEMSAAKSVFLIDGAVPQNVFWQVSGYVSIGANTHFEGVILGKTAITLGNGASVHGRMLAQTAVTLDMNIVKPSVTSEPVPVSKVNPIIPYWNNTGSQTITATGNANCTSIQLYYKYSINNVSWGGPALFLNDTASPWSWTFSFSNGTGYYQFYTRAWNNTGGREDAPVLADARCAYDNVLPTSVSNVVGAYWRNTSINVTATASDTTSGVASVALYYRYGAVNGTFGAWTLSSTDIMTPWSFSFAFASGQGYYEFYTIATDNATKAELAPGAADVRYGYDNVAPTSNANIITPYITVASPKIITAAASSTVSGFASVVLWYAYSATNVTFGANTSFGTDNAAPWSWSFNFPAGTGYYKFYTIATDNASNIEIAPVSVDTKTLYDSAAPSILTTTPIDDSSSISVNAGTYVIHFSEAMKTTPGTIQTTLPGVSWVWSTDKNWFNSTYTTLQPTMKYYVNLTGYTDLADNVLSGDVNKAFTTGSLSTSVRLPVNLGTAGNFVVLAKAGISTTGTTQIVGDIGVSPIDSTAITGFGLILDPSTQFSTSSLVTGKIYAADYSPPTPINMGVSIGNMETAYTDAAGRITPDYTELGAGDITGMTLPPGLYKWSTSVLISAGGVTLSGNASAVWIFQIGIDLTVASGAIVTLSGGARASNVFWQVAGQVTIETTVAMKGIILCYTLIEIKTGASLVGRALAQTAVTIDGNIITDPKDILAPTVSSTVPANAATGVAINSAMAATFSETMDPLTITNTTFTLKQGTTPILGTVTYAGLTATFTPTVNLAASTIYTATITTGAKDIAGNALASSYVWTFTTGAVADAIPPTVSSTVPANAATGVAINSAMTATFSEAMRITTIINTTFILKQGTTPVSGAVTYVGFTATFRPSANLASSTVYTATITTAAKDLAGNALASNYVWTFTTGAVVDTTPPTVSSTIPANAATDTAVNTAITATFSEAMNPLTITTTTFILKVGVASVSGTVTYTGVTATFTPSLTLAQFTEHTAMITTVAKDLAGNALARNYTWNFTTGDVVYITPPSVSFTIPVNTATEVSINSAMTATFSEAMDPLTITTTTIILKQGVTPVLGAVTYSLVTAAFTPTSNLAASTVYTATITTGAKNLAGTALASNYVWSFTTGLAPDIIAPMVTSTINANGATGVPINTKVGATFSEAMDPLTITTVTFTLMQSTTLISGTITYSGVSAVFTPLVNLAPSTLYTVTVKGGDSGVKDLAGNAMVTDFVISWTTGTVADTTAPMVTSTIPANGATGVSTTNAITATFSEGMDPLTITTITFSMKQGTTIVLGTVTYAGFTATFVDNVAPIVPGPGPNFAASTIYIATITTEVKDLAGNALVSNYVWSWTTGAVADTTAPMVTATIHTNGQTNVAINTKVGATFSEAMNPLTITTLTFTLKQGTTPVSGTVTYSVVSAVFTPLSNLAPSTLYTVTVKGGASGVKDLAGNAMVSDFVISWTTGVAPDTTPPTVTSTINANGATGVPINTKISATFSEGMDPLTITTVTFLFKQGATPVSGMVTYSLVSAVFTPLANLAPSTVYTATITTGAKDLAGNALASNYVWSWTTGTVADTTAPTVTSTINANGATGVPINTKVGATFSEGMDPLTITTVTFLFKQGATPVSGTVTYSLVSAVFTPASNLTASTVYTATITTGAKDLAGNALASNYTWSWTTGTAADTTAPTVIATVNANGATNVATNTRIAATFSEAMDHLTITTATFIFEQGTTQVSGTVTYSGVTAVFTPANILAANTEYTGTITTGARDLAGNALASDYVWSWTTGSAPDTAAPTVNSTVPANAATGVAINSAITATFSEAIDPLTMTTVTFTLMQGTTPVPGTVTYVAAKATYAAIATFTPASNLALNTVYTATITTAVTDLAGNALATNYVWSFDTNPVVIPPANGTIVGRIVDENGDPVQNATVSLGNTGVNATTNTTGYYTFSNVAPGTYSLGFNASGYEPAATTATVTAGQTTTVPDTELVPTDDGGAGNWWWIILVIAIILIAVYVLWEMAGKKKKSAEVPPKEGQGAAKKE
jgi:hypothetical protein